MLTDNKSLLAQDTFSEDVRVELSSKVDESLKSKPFVVAAIPAYDEEMTIAKVILQTQKYADEVIVCDDGSSDMTAEIAKKLGAEVIRHECNMGYGAALQSLFKRAMKLNADVLVTLDADGQHDPREIPTVVKPIIRRTADVVIGSRFVDANGTSEMPAYRQLGAKLIAKLVNGRSKKHVSDAQSGFRAYNRKALKCLSLVEVGMGASVEILFEANTHNLKICEVPASCTYDDGEVATSTENPIKHGIGVITSIVRLIIEERPLTVLGIPSLVFLFAGIGFGVWMLQIYAITHSIVTNIALASIAFVLIGFFMLSTAITLYAISRLSKRITGAK